MKEKKKDKFDVNKFANIFSKILFGVVTIFLLLFLIMVILTNILPFKYLTILIIFSILIEVVFAYFLIKKDRFLSIHFTLI